LGSIVWCAIRLRRESKPIEPLAQASALSARACAPGCDFSSRSFLSAPVQELLERCRWIGAQRITDFGELDHVKAPLTTLNLGHEGLRVTQSLTQFDLRHPGLLAQVA
jgi:hypothetical protein